MIKSPGVPDPAPSTLKDAFDLTGRIAVITGGAGLLGIKHAEAIIELGGIPVLVDVAADAARLRAAEVAGRNGGKALGLGCDITSADALKRLLEHLMCEFGRVDILVNNAANNPKVEDGLSAQRFSRLETFPLEAWNNDIAVGLTGAFLCSRIFGTAMAESGKGVILNIASDLGLIAPDQGLYRVDDGRPEAEQPVKPVTYSVVKAGIIGLTRYLATYWPGRVRANALAPGGVYADQPATFLARYAEAVPMARMAHRDEFKGAVAYLVSDASSFVTGTTLVVDGGHTVW
jgi:NAD(P)-dependent dehydrogenase (short-subunit alcohol dehydrogenase family)